MIAPPGESQGGRYGLFHPCGEFFNSIIAFYLACENCTNLSEALETFEVCPISDIGVHKVD
jgi:hypothetical protein